MSRGIYQPCLTWRSLLALVISAILVVPAMFFANLTIGGIFAISTWLIVILWAEIAHLFRQKLTPQEALIVQNFQTPVLLTASMFLIPGYGGRYGFLWRVFYAKSDVAYRFGFWNKLPSWWVPPIDSPVMTGQLRTLFHPSWTFPILTEIVIFLLSWIMSLSLGLLLYQVFVVAQRMEFPMQTATALGVTVVTERGREHRLFMVATALGLIMGFLGPFFPMVSGVTSTAVAAPISLNWTLEQFMPGASLGFYFDPLTFVVGLLLDLKIVLAILGAAYGAYFVGNHLLVRYGIWPTSTEVLGAWMPGATENYCIWWSQLHFWTSVQIGLAVAGAILPLFLNWKVFQMAVSSLHRLSDVARKEGLISFKWLLVMYFICGLLIVGITSWILPEFPWYYNLFFVLVWTFMINVVATGASGVTSGTFNIPWFKQGVLQALGVPINQRTWWAPLQLMNIGAASWVGSFKMARIARIRITEYIKAYLLCLALGLTSGLIYASLLWNLAPIPSGVYPQTMITWLNTAYWQALWIKWFQTGIVIKPHIVLWSAALGTAMYLGFQFLLRQVGLYYAMLIGLSLSGGFGFGTYGYLLYDSLPLALIGSLIGRLLRRRSMLGVEWSRARYIIASGIGAGISIVYTLAVALVLIQKAQWVLPY